VTIVTAEVVLRRARARPLILLLAYETDFNQESADKRIAAWSFEREYILEYGCELFTQAVSQHASRAMKPRSDCFRFYPKNVCWLASSTRTLKRASR
jgi:hypothetical protein